MSTPPPITIHLPPFHSSPSPFPFPLSFPPSPYHTPLLELIVRRQLFACTLLDQVRWLHIYRQGHNYQFTNRLKKGSVFDLHIDLDWRGLGDNIVTHKSDPITPLDVMYSTVHGVQLGKVGSLYKYKHKCTFRSIQKFQHIASPSTCKFTHLVSLAESLRVK